MKKFTTYSLIRTTVLTALLASFQGCNNSQPLEEANLSPEMMSVSDFHSVTLVSWVKKGDKDTEKPVYLVTNTDAYVIPRALRGSLKGVEPGTVINCPAKLYTTWQRATGSQSLVSRMSFANVRGESDTISYRFQSTDDDAEHIGYNGRICLVQTVTIPTTVVVGAIGPDRRMETRDTNYTSAERKIALTAEQQAVSRLFTEE